MAAFILKGTPVCFSQFYTTVYIDHSYNNAIAVSYFIVLEKHRRKGYGQKAVCHLQGIAQKQNLPLVFLCVYPDVDKDPYDSPMCKMLTKLDYHFIGDSLHMAKEQLELTQ